MALRLRGVALLSLLCCTNAALEASRERKDKAGPGASKMRLIIRCSFCRG